MQNSQQTDLASADAYILLHISPCLRGFEKKYIYIFLFKVRCSIPGLGISAIYCDSLSAKKNKLCGEDQKTKHQTKKSQQNPQTQPLRLNVESAINTQLCYNCFPLPSKPMSLEVDCGTVMDHITGKMHCASEPGRAAC